MGRLSGATWRDGEDTNSYEYDVDNDTSLDEEIQEIIAEQKVRGGRSARRGEIPHQVSLQNMAKSHPHFCGASIIHPLILLSAAHCFDVYNVLQNLRAVTGEQNFAVWQNAEQIRNISRLIIHENWNGTTQDNDIALVVLDEPLEFNNSTKPIRIPKENSILPLTAQVSGWGYVDRTGLAPDVLQMASIRFKSRTQCNNVYNQSGFLVTDKMICAGGKKDACEGDSGGPLTCRSVSTEPFLCGIVSWGNKHCFRGRGRQFPGVYTDVSRYHHWIMTHLQEIVKSHPYTHRRSECDTGVRLYPQITCITCPIQRTRGDGKPQRTYVALLHVQVEIEYRYSRTKVTSVMINPSATASEEVTFSVYLPNTAFISHFSMAINGTSHVATVKQREAARLAYNQAREGSPTAGIVEASSLHENLFNVSANVKPGTTVTFTLTYEELLPRRMGMYEQTIHVDLEKVRQAGSYEIVATVSDSRNITVLRALGMSSAMKNDEEIQGANVVRNGNIGTISWSPDTSNPHIPQRFVLQYDIKPQASTPSGQILIRDGYFTHFFSPSDIHPFEKHLIFILERSGSMDGRILSQLKEGVVDILDKLDRRDRFSIVTFNDNVAIRLQNVGYGHVNKAKNLTKLLKGAGGANLHEALLTALNLSTASNMKPIIMLFSSGNVTTTNAISNHAMILSEVAAANSDKNIPVYSLFLGPSSDFSFLQQLCFQNNGFARKLYPDWDPVPQYLDFYDEISSPLLLDLNFTYGTSNTKLQVSDVTVESVPAYFKGSDIVVLGKLVQSASPGGTGGSQWLGCDEETANTTFGLESEPGIFTATVHGRSKDGRRDFRSSQAIHCNCLIQRSTSFMERLWAYLTVRELLQEAETLTNGQLNEMRRRGCEEPRKYARHLALKYGFVTPVTSLIVVQTNGSHEIVEWPEKSVVGFTVGTRTATNDQKQGKGREAIRCRKKPPKQNIPCLSSKNNETTAGSNGSLNLMKGVKSRAGTVKLPSYWNSTTEFPATTRPHSRAA